MSKGKVFVVGIGPGSLEDITVRAIQALGESDVVVGYKPYFKYIEPYIPVKAKCVASGMRHEVERAEYAFQLAEEGKTVSVISSGDSQVYGMAAVVMDVKLDLDTEVEVEIVPGVSAFQKAASLLGAPLGSDFCVVSLSDLQMPWDLIERRIEGALWGHFVLAVYNPRSNGRYWQMQRVKTLYLEADRGDVVVGYVRNAGREDEEVNFTTMAEFNPEEVDMFTIVVIGNLFTMLKDGYMFTPRDVDLSVDVDEEAPVGQQIMQESFGQIRALVDFEGMDDDEEWVKLHVIHTTGDTGIAKDVLVEPGDVRRMYEALASGRVRTIVTDVKMAAMGIRKKSLGRLGLQVKCYIDDERAVALAAKEGITRAAAGIRLAVSEHPDALFAIGNAPTALMELCRAIHDGRAMPAGVIGVPVGFVHVRESKYMLQAFEDLPKVVLAERRGGSNVAATVVNAILSYPDIEKMNPGQEL